LHTIIENETSLIAAMELSPEELRRQLAALQEALAVASRERDAAAARVREIARERDAASRERDAAAARVREIARERDAERAFNLGEYFCSLEDIWQKHEAPLENIEHDMFYRTANDVQAINNYRVTVDGATNSSNILADGARSSASSSTKANVENMIFLQVILIHPVNQLT
jgi:chromosome segregation ATPase